MHYYYNLKFLAPFIIANTFIKCFTKRLCMIYCLFILFYLDENGKWEMTL